MTFSISRRPAWAIPEREAAPEELFLDRRKALQMAAALGAGMILPEMAFAQDKDPSAGLYPAKRNEAYKLDRPLTPEKLTSTYNNFYEFGGSKNIHAAAQALKTRPWLISIDGMVEKPFEIGIDDLLKKVQLEERLYRLRCVEAWSMTIPWTGFPMKALLDIAKPQSGAKYIRFETFKDPKMAPGQRQVWYPWPYVEGCTVAEAANDLAFFVTGAYGKPLAKQYGAPIRVHMPWKYGFKGIKSIKKITFTDKRPKSFWEGMQASEYGFWANVNPDVSHPRWSQATEAVLGENKRVPTLIWNGYGEQVASLYKGMEKTENLFM
ncbi:MAG: protein-methionine-sulfoxide reductase catalytic subunit MsrP [Beijerinckiaceae bacterium]